MRVIRFIVGIVVLVVVAFAVAALAQPVHWTDANGKPVLTEAGGASPDPSPTYPATPISAPKASAPEITTHPIYRTCRMHNDGTMECHDSDGAITLTGTPFKDHDVTCKGEK
jgi:hypothetical protein